MPQATFEDFFEDATVHVQEEPLSWASTGNLFIEYEREREAAGIAAIDAQFWCHVLMFEGEQRGYLIFPAERLKQICRPLFKTSRDIEVHGSRGIVLSLRDLLSDLGTVQSGRDHVCEVCGGSAAFGFGVNTRKGQPGRWFCSMHRAEGGRS